MNLHHHWSYSSCVANAFRANTVKEGSHALVELLQMKGPQWIGGAGRVGYLTLVHLTPLKHLQQLEWQLKEYEKVVLGSMRRRMAATRIHRQPDTCVVV